MKVLFLTDRTTEDNGYAIVGQNLQRALARRGVDLQCLSADEYRSLRPSARSLKSPYYARFGWLAVGFDLVAALLACRGRRFDHVHCNVEHYAPLAWCLSRLWRVPYTVTAHGTYGVLLPVRYGSFARAFAAAQAVIAVSAYTRRRMEEEGVRASLEVVPNGVDRSVFTPDPGVAKEDLVLFVGAPKPRKGFAFLFDALQLLAARGRAFRLVTVGNFGPEREAWLGRAREAGVVVEMAGKADQPRLVDLYRRARVNVLPSRSDRFHFEGFGLIHVEAIACGTLTIGCSESGNEDAVAPGNGFLVRHGDVPALADAIESALQRPAGEARPQGPAPKDWDQVADGYLEIFRRTAASSLGRRREAA